MWKNISPFQQQLLELLALPQPDQEVTVEAGGSGIRLEKLAQGWRVTLAQPAQLGRAAMLLEQHAHQSQGWVLEEKPVYARLGAMLDCSRNAVPRPETLKKLLRILCRMGYNTLQLYMEDVYSLPDFPYFGYGRGGYTKEELRQLDRYAAALGIELIPAIQTLAHLGQSLKWKAMRPLVDVGDILLIDNEDTYRLIGQMFDVLRDCFSTHRINVGMDEAHLVGLGKYLDLHGYTDRTALMLRHFEKVRQIAADHDFAPMLWSDMFFRLASGGDYYAPDCTIDPAVARSIPEDTTLLYWDYYSEAESTYDRMLDKHAQLCPRTIFAGGAWKWSGYAPCNRFSIRLADMAHASCKRHGIQEVLLTMWGDNGAECSPFAVLPSLQYWAELCWADSTDDLEARFAACTGGDWQDFLLPDELVFTPDNPAPGRCAVNATKTLTYEDILMPLFSHTLDLPAWQLHLEDCLTRLEQARQRQTQWQPLFEQYAALCAFLLEKCRVQRALRPAWAAKDRAVLKQLCKQDLPRLQQALERFIRAQQDLWLEENKPAGLDVLDIRLGGQNQRIATAIRRLEDWLAGRCETVEELDTPLLPYDPDAYAQGYRDLPAAFWHEIASPSSIAMI